MPRIEREVKEPRPNRGYVAIIVGAALGAIGSAPFGSLLGSLVAPIYRNLAPAPDCEGGSFAAGFGCAMAWLLAPYVIASIVAALLLAIVGSWVALRFGRHDRRWQTISILTLLIILWASGMLSILNVDEDYGLVLFVVAMLVGLILPLVARAVGLRPFRERSATS